MLFETRVHAQERSPSLENSQAFQAFAKSHCLECHDSDSAEGGFDLADVLQGKDVSSHPAAWHAALERIASRDMPPKSAKVRPTEDEYRRAEDWISGMLGSASPVSTCSSGLASGFPETTAAPSASSPRSTAECRDTLHGSSSRRACMIYVVYDNYRTPDDVIK